MMPKWLGAVLMAVTAATVAAYVADRYNPARDEVIRLDYALRSQGFDYTLCLARAVACQDKRGVGGGP